MRGLVRLLDGVIALFPRRAWWFFAVVCVALIAYSGSRPASELPDFGYLPPHSDKFLHFVAYAGLAACLFRAVFPLVATRPSPWGKLAWAPVILIPSIVGAVDEAIIQGMARGRGQDVWDWVADTLAGVTVFAAGVVWRERVRRRDEELRRRGRSRVRRRHGHSFRQTRQ